MGGTPGFGRLRRMLHGLCCAALPGSPAGRFCPRGTTNPELDNTLAARVGSLVKWNYGIGLTWSKDR